ncbi:hypothetical protein HAX54_028282 [Datura stramonium]|uniref:Uncharacterized protein n=1 Tax=Datura stramonium TaxID=4076 RepID=A0ABS8V6G3_DATST|nr:hypothetical protein [Datura stramonium]
MVRIEEWTFQVSEFHIIVGYLKPYLRGTSHGTNHPDELQYAMFQKMQPPIHVMSCGTIQKSILRTHRSYGYMSHPMTRGISSQLVGWSIGTVQQVPIHDCTILQKDQASKKQQDNKVQIDIASKRALKDQLEESESKESNAPSGSMENYNIDTDENDEPQTPRAQAKSKSILPLAILIPVP